jgi:hypothetical protein
MKYLSHLTIYAYLPILIGALLGAALGYFGQCSSGTCPLTSTWWRGAIYGAVLGTIFFFTSGKTTDSSQARDLRKPEQNNSGN